MSRNSKDMPQKYGVSDFFNMAKPLARKELPSGSVHLKSLASESDIDSLCGSIVDSEQYIQEAREKEQLFLKNQRETLENEMEALSIASSISNIKTTDRPNMSKMNDGIYKRYGIDGKPHKTNLNIEMHRQSILLAIQNNTVNVIEGATGCGKSTQVPQFILDDAAANNKPCNIIVTQPRRIAAISLSNRVCQERKWTQGTICGYQIGLKASRHEDTRLLYCTTGVFLQKLVKRNNISEYTHIILDEVHEREEEMDFLLIIIRRLINDPNNTVKLLLMSATIDSNKFAEYFRMNTESGFGGPASILSVGSERQFDVKFTHFDDMVSLISRDIYENFESPEITKMEYDYAAEVVLYFENIDIESRELASKPSILVFLPGVNEIALFSRTLENIISAHPSINFKILPLHSLLPSEDQQAVFRPVSGGCRKIILSTNIAESSITVPDVKYVIDFCRTKLLMNDSNSFFSALKLQWASKENCTQRAGRVGRVMPGHVMRMCSKKFYQKYIPAETQPSMLRCPLANCVLKSKCISLGKPHEVLGLAMDPPDYKSIMVAILILKQSGALTYGVKGLRSKWIADDGDLTLMGRVMSCLPMDIRLSRLIFLGYMFDLFQECIIIAAGLSVRTVFTSPPNYQYEAYVNRMRWSLGSGSDLVAILNVYKAWRRHIESNKYVDNSEEFWARRYFVEIRSMKEMATMVAEVEYRLQGFGIEQMHGNQRVAWADRDKAAILKVIIAGAFYPNYFSRSIPPNSFESYERAASMEVCGFDICRSVYFSGFDNENYTGKLYRKAVLKLIEKTIEQNGPVKMVTHFAKGTQKIIVTFVDNGKSENEAKADLKHIATGLPGQVPFEVYKAIKLGKLLRNFTIFIMPKKEEERYLAQNPNTGNNKELQLKELSPKALSYYNIPLSNVTEFGAVVSHIENCSKFYLHLESDRILLTKIKTSLNTKHSKVELLPFESTDDVKLNSIAAANFHNSYEFSRVKILGKTSTPNGTLFRVFFIDYGNVCSLDLNKLRQLPEDLTEIPGRALQCCLVGVQPSAVFSQVPLWTETANNFLKDKTTGIVVRAEVYSVVKGITNTILHIGDKNESDSGNINRMLVDLGFADIAEETYMSKMDHYYRQSRLSSMGNPFINKDVIIHELTQYLGDTLTETNDDDEEPKTYMCTEKVNLKGPNSPLECILSPMLTCGHSKQIQIEQNSVNSVLLNTDPQDAHDRLLVAAALAVSADDTKMSVYWSTLMPNVHGFATLLGLIFCPRMEMQTNVDRNRYTCFLTGMGCDPETGLPLFPQHDVVFNPDVEISTHDLETINRIRYIMDSLLQQTDSGVPKFSRLNRLDMINTLKKLVMELLSAKRPAINAAFNPRQRHWGEMDKLYHTHLRMGQDVYGGDSIFPGHKIVELTDMPIGKRDRLRRHLVQLQFACDVGVLGDLEKCLLCDKSIENISQLRLHLYSNVHRDAVSRVTGGTN